MGHGSQPSSMLHSNSSQENKLEFEVFGGNQTNDLAIERTDKDFNGDNSWKGLKQHHFFGELDNLEFELKFTDGTIKLIHQPEII